MRLTTVGLMAALVSGCSAGSQGGQAGKGDGGGTRGEDTGVASPSGDTDSGMTGVPSGTDSGMTSGSDSGATTPPGDTDSGMTQPTGSDSGSPVNDDATLPPNGSDAAPDSQMAPSQDSSIPTGAFSWKTLRVGAGGFVRGMDIASDGTMVARTDTYGAYLWNGTKWQELVTSSTMPAAAVTVGNNQGVYEIRIAPSSTSTFYMAFLGNVYVSQNKGETWTQTTFTQDTSNNPNDGVGQYGQKMAVDPYNQNIVFAGTEQNGLFVTKNGGTTWQSVAGLPKSLANSSGTYPGITGIVFDPATGSPGGTTSTLYASSYGNGVYESTNGGATWTALGGGPTDADFAALSSTGAYFAAANNASSVWRYASGAWTQVLTSADVGGNGVQAVAVDPMNASHVVATTPGGTLNESFDAGMTWTGLFWSSQCVSTDIPWLAGANGAAGVTTDGWMDIGGFVFDPTVPNKLWASAGIGVWTIIPPASGAAASATVTFTDQSIGIEQLVSNEIVVPPGGKPVLASWDRPFFYAADVDQYPQSYGPIESGTIVAGWSVDYASSSPSFLVGIAEWWGQEESGYSTNGGQTWTKFASAPPGASSSYMGGTITASTPMNIVWAPADNNQPYYTTNGGTTWSPVDLPGVTSWSGFDFGYYLDTRTVTADRVTPGTFYLFFSGSGLYTTTDGGATWQKTYTGDISPFDGYNAELESVPGQAGNLFFSGGPQSGTPPGSEPFMRSTDGGTTWTAVPNVLQVYCFGFGAPQQAGGYPAIYIVGWVNSVYGIWQSDDDAQTWTSIGTWPLGSLDAIKTISGDPNTYGEVYVGFGGSGYAYYGP